jgi:hypothetical protein
MTATGEDNPLLEQFFFVVVELHHQIRHGAMG